jgi:hypothetical protein
MAPKLSASSYFCVLAPETIPRSGICERPVARPTSTAEPRILGHGIFLLARFWPYFAFIWTQESPLGYMLVWQKQRANLSFGLNLGTL